MLLVRRVAGPLLLLLLLLGLRPLRRRRAICAIVGVVLLVVGRVGGRVILRVATVRCRCCWRLGCVCVAWSQRRRWRRSSLRGYRLCAVRRRRRHIGRQWRCGVIGRRHAGCWRGGANVLVVLCIMLSILLLLLLLVPLRRQEVDFIIIRVTEALGTCFIRSD